MLSGSWCLEVTEPALCTAKMWIAAGRKRHGSARETHLAAVDLVGGVGGAAHELQSALEVLVPQLHLAPLAPHCCQILHILECHLSQDSRVKVMGQLAQGSRAHMDMQ